MTIGIIVAMTKELNLLLPLMEEHAVSNIGGTEFHTGKIHGHDVVLMECGIGKVNAAIGTVTLIDTFHPDLVINTGVAAGAGENVAVMDAIVATQVAHHDFWCIGEEWGRVPGCPRLFPTLTYPEAVKGANVKRGLIASGELFITSREQVDAIKKNFPDVLAIDMESAAIAQACYVRNVPFFCMRVISDTPWCHHDNSAQYENFWEDAPRQSFGLIKSLIESL
ncbi:MAG: 5'-methylthioadenosine/adenosylhomocysteine nucleosidase [Paenibacillus sp.]|nr:5'-methylthioadenosine/adenosylhomocysteine nucleosidase [Paenibacillus sp.]